MRTAVVVGLVAGVVSFAAYDALPAPWDRLGDSAGLWCLLTWWVGQRVRPLSLPWAALAGLLTQLCLLAGFYGALVVLAGRGDDPLRVLAWTALALVAGPAFGVLGTLRWARGWLATASSALLGAAVSIEPLLGVVPRLVGELRTLPQGAQDIGPSSEALQWCIGAALLGLVAATLGSPRGRRARSAVLAALAVVVGGGALVVQAAWSMRVWG